MDAESKAVVKIVATVVFVIVLFIGFGLWGCPQYNVYNQRLVGEAELARAEYSRQVQVRDAQGKLSAASLLAQVEVARAEGVAKANVIIGDSLRNNEAYLRWLWINEINAAGHGPTVIYVPTEAGLPILEAGKRPEASDKQR